MTPGSHRWIWMPVLVLLTVAPCVHAQAATLPSEAPGPDSSTAGTGERHKPRILVRVHDLEGNALPGAYVVAVVEGRFIGGFADSLGERMLPLLPWGRYKVIVRSAAHESFEQVVAFDSTGRGPLDVNLDVLPELKGQTVVMHKSGDATVGDYLYGRDGSRWIMCALKQRYLR